MHCFLNRARPLALALSLLHIAGIVNAQRPPAQPNAAEILHKMQKLNVLGSVLYIVAHPDDENTRLIAWLANGKKVRTGNLSLTRGDGGQNLIGPELGDALGIIRTQELLEARRIDGGEQFFTRAVDFGYSKSAAESFEKWGKQEVLSDVVRVIRMFRPDIIITRFAPDRSAGHGHHEASAILAEEAFDLAGDPMAFPEQLQQGLEVWQPRRLFFNGSTWWKKDLADIAKNDPDWFSVDVGGYDPLLGLSYTEIAGRSRSMHKSQGFGAAETRGEMLEYLRFIKGDRPKTKDIFEGIDMTWGRVGPGTDAQRAVEALVAGFDPLDPAASLPELMTAHNAITVNHEVEWSYVMSDRINSLIAQCLGTTSEVVASHALVTQGSADVTIIVNNRSSYDLSLDNIDFNQERELYLVANEHLLSPRATLTEKVKADFSKAAIDQPYWLAEKHGSLHNVQDTRLIGNAVKSFEYAAHYEVRGGASAPFRMDFGPTYKWVDRVAGERIRPVYVTPVASVIPQTDVLIARGGPQEVVVEVEALTDSLVGQVNVTLPEGWATTKDLKTVNIAKRNERRRFTYQLIPGADAKAGAVKFKFSGPKGKADRTLHEIDYPHIMPQVYYTPAEVKLVPLDVQCTAKTVGYIKGAGDDVPEALEQLGVKVDIVDPATATLESLKKYDAIVTGIRAYNTTKELKELNPVLMKYVEEGGTLVCQYNTRSSDMVLPDSLFGPYPFKLTRDRVTVEEAPPTFLQRDHPLLSFPNKISSTDFDGWVQERGLYFCGSLDEHYTPLIAWNDPGEQPLTGGLITCDWGKGRYVYTGISFFRQLPAGVPGAYRLFANLISSK